MLAPCDADVTERALELMTSSLKQLLRPLYRVLQPLYAPLVNGLIKQRRQAAARRDCVQQVAQLVAADKPLKIIIGANTQRYADWVATDINCLDITQRDDWQQLCGTQKVQAILGEHVIEHLTEAQFRQFLRVVQPFLAPQANIRIAIPDGHHPDPDYIAHVRPGGIGPGADDHKLLYTHGLMANILESEGYAYRFLEHFDEAGTFHRVEWDDAHGHIARSQAHDARNTPDNPTAYTSLIVDFWRP